MNALILAWAYLRFHWGRSLVLVAVTALILFVPLATRLMLRASERQLTARAEATPMVLGARGSRLDLVMAALYFSDEQPEPLTMAAADAVWEGALALPIPLHTAFEAEGARIVGTTLEYFDFRALEVAQGRQMAVLGDAVLGATVAARTGLGVGGTIVSSPRSLFDLDGIYPLEMPVVGVLAPANGPDDEAVFVDLKTAWVISGIGHGHDDVLAASATTGDVVAALGIVQFNRITPDNIDGFHFHGDPEGYPISAVLLDPANARSATILKGRYLDAEGPVQAVVPAEVVGGLVERIFRIRTVLDAVSAITGTAALAAVALAVFLSYRLREREVATAFAIGAQRGTIFALLTAETVILLCAAGAIAGVATLAVAARADAWVGWLLGLRT